MICIRKPALFGRWPIGERPDNPFSFHATRWPGMSRFPKAMRGRLGRAILAAWAVLLLQAAQAQDLLRSDGHWVDDRARSFELSSLHGRPTVVTMAYGACRRICSTSLRVMEQVQALADQSRIELNFVVVGLDPSQDKPADWAEFRRDRKLQRPNWYFLSGDTGSTHRAAQRLGIQYWRYGDHTMHDFKILLLAEDGRLLRAMDKFGQDPASLLP